MPKSRQIGDDGADRSAACLSGDLLWCRQSGETGGSIADRPDRRRRARLTGGGHVPRLGWRVQSHGDADDPRFQYLGSLQPAGDASQDLPDVGYSEAMREVRVRTTALERGGEFLAVVDQPANEIEEAPGRAWFLGASRAGGKVRG